MDANDILNSPEMKKLFNEAKWMLFLGAISDKEIADSSGVGEDVTRPMYEFFKVFYDHGVELDIVIEAVEKLRVLPFPSDVVPPKKNNEVSSSDLTSFVKVLNDIQKKKGES
jgi:hypothetical protein